MHFLDFSAAGLIYFFKVSNVFCFLKWSFKEQQSASMTSFETILYNSTAVLLIFSLLWGDSPAQDRLRSISLCVLASIRTTQKVVLRDCTVLLHLSWKSREDCMCLRLAKICWMLQFFRILSVFSVWGKHHEGVRKFAVDCSYWDLSRQGDRVGPLKVPNSTPITNVLQRIHFRKKQTEEMYKTCPPWEHRPPSITVFTNLKVPLHCRVSGHKLGFANYMQCCDDWKAGVGGRPFVCSACFC